MKKNLIELYGKIKNKNKMNIFINYKYRFKNALNLNILNEPIYSVYHLLFLLNKITIHNDYDSFIKLINLSDNINLFELYNLNKTIFKNFTDINKCLLMIIISEIPFFKLYLKLKLLNNIGISVNNFNNICNNSNFRKYIDTKYNDINKNDILKLIKINLSDKSYSYNNENIDVYINSSIFKLNNTINEYSNNIINLLYKYKNNNVNIYIDNVKIDNILLYINKYKTIHKFVCIVKFNNLLLLNKYYIHNNLQYNNDLFFLIFKNINIYSLINNYNLSIVNLYYYLYNINNDEILLLAFIEFISKYIYFKNIFILYNLNIDKLINNIFVKIKAIYKHDDNKKKNSYLKSLKKYFNNFYKILH